ncbi:MAG: DUF305 domain-containing protein, partial [Candidatus Acidiferrales bacterium]
FVIGLEFPKMLKDGPRLRVYGFHHLRKLGCAGGAALLGVLFFSVSAPAGFLPTLQGAQQNNSAASPGANPATTSPSAPPAVVVQPGAPGQPTKRLPNSTKGTLPPPSPADVAFMQGMIMHHSQAVEMTAWIPSHTENKDLRLLGARISSSQSDEINFMRRWLAARGEPTSLPMAGMPNMNASGKPDMDKAGHSSGGDMPLMPGMLTPEQMAALNAARGAEFDRLFLVGMIQHHNGALIMVKDLFDTAGAGQDADIFNFATDADNTQRAEIRIMQSMLDKKSLEEKR